MKEYMVNYRGYICLWAEDEEEVKKIFQRRFRHFQVGGELEHIEVSLYQDTEEKEQTWRK